MAYHSPSHGRSNVVVLRHNPGPHRAKDLGEDRRCLHCLSARRWFEERAGGAFNPNADSLAAIKIYLGLREANTADLQISPPINNNAPATARGHYCLFRSQELLDPTNTRSIEGGKYFGFGLFAQVLQRLTDRRVFQNASMNKTELQGNSAFHV